METILINAKKEVGTLMTSVSIKCPMTTEGEERFSKICKRATNGYVSLHYIKGEGERQFAVLTAGNNILDDLLSKIGATVIESWKPTMEYELGI